MPKKMRMFPGITRQVVISDTTHQLLAHAAHGENKYIGELADELIRQALEARHQHTHDTNGLSRRTPATRPAPAG
jgi:hypothetical protein